MESETYMLWKLLWKNGIKFKSRDPEHEPELIMFIRNRVTKRVYPQENNRVSYIVDHGMNCELELK